MNDAWGGIDFFIVFHLVGRIASSPSNLKRERPYSTQHYSKPNQRNTFHARAHFWQAILNYFTIDSEIIIYCWLNRELFLLTHRNVNRCTNLRWSKSAKISLRRIRAKFCTILLDKKIQFLEVNFLAPQFALIY